MKKIYLQTVILFAFLAVYAFPGCKYDEGPFFSIYSKRERIAGTKTFTSVVVNGRDLTEEYTDQYIIFYSGGDFYWAIEPGEIYGQAKEYRLGNWALIEHKDKFQMLFLNDSSTYEWDIKRLSYADMYLEMTQDTVHTRWELYQRY